MSGLVQLGVHFSNPLNRIIRMVVCDCTDDLYTSLPPTIRYGGTTKIVNLKTMEIIKDVYSPETMGQRITDSEYWGFMMVPLKTIDEVLEELEQLNG